MIGPYLLRGRGGETDLVKHCACIPRLAHAIAVHVAHAHVCHHLRRRHGDYFRIGHRVDAVGGEPVIKPHRVGASRKRLRERVFAFFFFH